MMLHEDVKQSIKESVLCWLATTDENGVPNCSPKEVFTYTDKNGNSGDTIGNSGDTNSGDTRIPGTLYIYRNSGDTIHIS